jgi:hypothetical protein
MISIASLWLPILVAAVLVFVVSSVMHMFIGYHWGDLPAVPNQAAVLEALRELKLPPGDYMLPKSATMKQMRSAEYVQQIKQGPVVLMSVGPGGMAMGRSLAQWFVYLLLVGSCCAYIASRELQPGARYLAVFRLVGFSAFMAYALALPQASIWYRRNWRMTLTGMFDGLVFALLSGGVFGWLWPR